MSSDNDDGRLLAKLSNRLQPILHACPIGIGEVKGDDVDGVTGQEELMCRVENLARD